MKLAMPHLEPLRCGKRAQLKAVQRARLAGLVAVNMMVLLYAVQTACAQAVTEPAAGPELVVQSGHSSWATTIAFSPDGHTLASGSYDHTIKLWDALSGELQQTLRGHRDIVRSVTFSPDGETLASGSQDETVKLWDVHTGVLKHTLRPRRAPARILDPVGASVGAVAFSPDGRLLASGGDDSRVRFWDAMDGALLQTLAGRDNRILSLAFAPDGTTLASGGSDKVIRLWDMRNILQGTPEPLRVLAGHQGRINSLAFAPSSRILASGSGDNTLKLWDVQTGAVQKTLTGHGGWVNAVAFAPDGQHLVSVSGDMTARWWDVATGTSKQILNQVGWIGEIFAVAFSPDGHTLATANQYRSIQLWNAGNWQLVRRLTRAHRMFGVAFSPDGKTIAGGCTDRTIKIWSRDKVALEKSLAGHTDEVHAVLFTPDSNSLLSAGDDGTVRLWDMTGLPGERGRLQRTLNQPYPFVRALALAADGKTAAIASSSTEGLTAKRDVRFWDLATGESKGGVAATNGAATALAFVPEPARKDRTAPARAERQLLEVASAGALEIWATAGAAPTTLTLQRTWPTNGRILHCIAFSPDGTLLATGSGDRTVGAVALRPSGEIKLWNTGTGTVTGQLLDHHDIVTALAFAPNGRLLASGSGDCQVDLWDGKGELQQMLSGHEGLISGLAFAPDGKLLASASEDGTIKLWRIADGALLVTLAILRPTQVAPEAPDSTAWLAYTPSGYYDGSAGVERYLRWRVDGQLRPGETYAKSYHRPDLLQAALAKE